MINTNQYFPVYNSLTQTVGIDYFGTEDRVYWVDLDKTHSGVYSVRLSGKDFKAVHTTGLKSPEDLAIDWMGGNIYITDAELNKIVVCNIDGEFCNSGLFEELDLPRGIVVEPSEGRLFWSEWGKRPGIYTAGMDGSNKRHLISDEIVWPNGLALDVVSNRLYWSEAKYGRIEFLDLETNHRRVVLQDKIFHPFSLAVFEDSLYWSDWITYSLDMSNKFTGHNQTTLVREMNEHIMGVHVFHPLAQKLSYNPCLSHKCSHMCVLAPNKGYTCVCPDQLILSKDRKTCQQMPATIATTTTEMVTSSPIVHKDVIQVVTRQPKSRIFNTESNTKSSNKKSLKVKSVTKDVTPEVTRHPDIKASNSEAETDPSVSNMGWITLLVAVMIVAIIVLLITVIIKRDDYREVRNVLYSRTDQLKYAVSLQNPLFRKAFRRQADEEEPLTEDNKSLHEGDKY
ncbi:unnamed protein product [Medioppia subpectinata]|uniref:Vitellogenin receptor n=1 Tax=Medioppia subpectinata TaxID=1979941 RepID=A0A7R9KUE1_9ACAR|nr:unnamed protein product [Medioppia subpectinata]CAG2110064.1 unnamed protein product [Medioppia subpectinata]